MTSEDLDQLLGAVRAALAGHGVTPSEERVLAGLRVMLAPADTALVPDPMAVIESLQDVYYRTDREGRLVAVTPSIRERSGYHPEEILGTFMADHYVEPDGRERFLQALAAAGGVISNYEAPLRRKDGSVMWVSTNARLLRDGAGEVVGVEGLVSDITARKRAEEGLRASEQRFRNIVEATGDWIWEVDSHGVYTYASPQVETLLGYRPGEVVGRTPFDLMPPAEAARVGPYFEEMVREVRGCHCYENINLSKDGREVVLETSAVPFFGDDGELAGFRGIDRDVTARRRAQDALRANLRELEAAHSKLKQMQAQLLQSEKMASIGQLAAGVAHEINNPVGYVYSNIGNLGTAVRDLMTLLEAYEGAEARLPADGAERAGIQALKERVDLEFLKRDVLDLIDESREGVTRVKEIVRDLKEFSHAGDQRREWTDLHTGLESTLNIVWNELKYKAELVKEFGELPAVRCVPSQINQVFMNLLVNAAQAIDDKGRITVRTGAAPEAGEVWVEVADTGRGIPPEQLDRIFEPFYTTKPVGQGTGLGLALSYSIVNHHGGRIDVDSAPGAGSRFRVILPVAVDEAADETVDEAADARDATGARA